MRKILFALTIIVLLIFTGFVMYQGTTFGKLHIWGVKQIQDKNEEIDEKNQEMHALVEKTYPTAINTLNKSSEDLEKNKKEYENQAVLLADSKYYKQTEKYKVEFLWTKLGNYAKDNNVELKLEATASTTSGLYDLNFTSTGKYADVAQFIYDIENDSRLGFKIENFSMNAVSNTTEEGQTIYNRVEGKFTCKEIKIDIKSIDKDAQTNNNTNEKNTNTNSTNTTTNTTSNSTATSNTTTNNTATESTNSDVDVDQIIEDGQGANGNTAQ